MNLFNKDKPKSVPQSYAPVLEAQEVIDLFSRLTLHQQAALNAFDIQKLRDPNRQPNRYGLRVRL